MDPSIKEHPRAFIINKIKSNLNKTFKLVDFKCLTGDFLVKLYKNESDKHSEKDLLQMAHFLGYSTLDKMLQSEEFSDNIDLDYSDRALGGDGTEKVFCYRSKLGPIDSESPQKPEINKRIMENEKCRESFSTNIKENEGRIRLIEAIYRAGGENEWVPLLDVQSAYYRTYDVYLNKSELRRFFPANQILKIFETRMANEVQTKTIISQTGSLFIKLKKPYHEIMSTMNNFKPSIQKITEMPNFSFSSSNRNISEKNSHHPPTEQQAPELIPKYVKHDVFKTNDVELYKKYANQDDPLKFLENEDEDSKREAFSSTIFDFPVSSKFDLKNLNADTNFGKSDQREAENSSSSIFEMLKKNMEKNLRASSSNNENEDLLGSHDEQNDYPYEQQQQQKQDQRELVVEEEEEEEEDAEKQLESFFGPAYQKSAIEKNLSGFDEENILLNGAPPKEMDNSHSTKYNKHVPGLLFTNNQQVVAAVENNVDGVETDSDDELEAGNRIIREENIRKNKFEENLKHFGKAEERKCPDVVPAVETDEQILARVNNSREMAHGERYLMRAYQQQQQQNQMRRNQSEIDSSKTNTPANINNSFAFPTIPQKLPQQQQPKSTDSAIVNGMFNKFNNWAEFKVQNAKNRQRESELDEDFYLDDGDDCANSPTEMEINLTTNKNLPGAQIMPNSQLKHSHSSRESATLAVMISVILMNRKSSMTLSEMKQALNVLYGKKITLDGPEFGVKSWHKFIKKYCKNIQAIETPQETLLVWLKTGDAEFRDVLYSISENCVNETEDY